jgi:hypothetical protein
MLFLFAQEIPAGARSLKLSLAAWRSNADSLSRLQAPEQVPHSVRRPPMGQFWLD